MIEHLKGFDYDKATNEKTNPLTVPSSRSSAKSDLLN
jgi:hypothetical protein